jgi:hypothetical protein
MIIAGVFPIPAKPVVQTHLPQGVVL